MVLPVVLFSLLRLTNDRELMGARANTPHLQRDRRGRGRGHRRALAAIDRVDRRPRSLPLGRVRPTRRLDPESATGHPSSRRRTKRASSKGLDMQPLEGIKILDLSRLAPGPFCSMMLGDLGADVLLVEAPADGQAGARWRSAAAATSTEQKTAAYNMLAPQQAEHRAEPARAGGARDLLQARRDRRRRARGLPAGRREAPRRRLRDADRKRNPRIVYCSLSGFGQTGPYSQLVGHDINYISVGGALGMIGWPDEPPAIPMNIIADFAGGGMHAAYGILAALMARERTGRGQYVDIAMSDGVLYLLASLVGSVLMGGASPSRGGDAAQRLGAALQRVRVQRRRLDQHRQPGAALLRQPVQGDGVRAVHPAPVGRRRSATEIAALLQGAVRDEDARRVVRDPEADRHLRRSRVLARGGAARSAQPGARDGGRSRSPDARQGEARSASARSSRTRRARCGPPRRSTGQHTDDVLASIGIDAARSRRSRSAASSADRVAEAPRYAGTLGYGLPRERRCRTPSDQDLELSILNVAAHPEPDGNLRVMMTTSRGEIRAVLHPCATAPGAAIYVGGALGGFEGPANDLYGRLADRLRPQAERPPPPLPPAGRIRGVRARRARGRVVPARHRRDGRHRARRPLVRRRGRHQGRRTCRAPSLAWRRCRRSCTARSTVERLGKPLLLVHGMRDGVLDHAASEDIHARAVEPKRLVLYAEADHTLARRLRISKSCWRRGFRRLPGSRPPTGAN